MKPLWSSLEEYASSSDHHLDVDEEEEMPHLVTVDATDDIIINDAPRSRGRSEPRAEPGKRIKRKTTPVPSFSRPKLSAHEVALDSEPLDELQDGVKPVPARQPGTFKKVSKTAKTK